MSQNTNPITQKAGLIVNFYGRRGQMSALQQTIAAALNLAGASSNNQDMSDPHRHLYLFRSDPPSNHDTTVIHLALSEWYPNQSDDAKTVWADVSDLWQDKEFVRILDEGAEQKDQKGRAIFWGYSLIYHAAIATGRTLDQPGKENLLKLARRPDLPAWKTPKPLAHSKIEGSDLWLMDIPNQWQGSQAATVYAALAPSDKEDDLITKILLGPTSALLMPDLIAHKAYYQRRQYVGPPQTRDQSLRTLYKKRINELHQIIGPFLGFTPPNRQANQPIQHKNLADLKFAYGQLLYVTSKLDEPHLSLAQQLQNYQWWQDTLGEGNLATYHDKQIEAAHNELGLLIQKGQNMLEAAHTTIDIQQTELTQAQEQREYQIGMLIALLGTALALSQIIDTTAADALFELFELYNQEGVQLSAKSSLRLRQLLIQLVPLFVTSVILLYWWFRNKYSE